MEKRAYKRRSDKKKRKACWYKDKCPDQSCKFWHPNPEPDTMPMPTTRETSYPSATGRLQSQVFVNSNMTAQTHGAYQTDNYQSNVLTMTFTSNVIKNKQFHTKREAEVLKSYEKRISELKTEIENITALISIDSNGNDEENLSVKSTEALKSQLDQLNTKVEVYKSIKIGAYGAPRENDQELSQRIGRELFRFESGLPVFAKRLKIEKLFESSPRVIIIHGQTGSGKSTQIPQYVADHPKFYGKRIICTQPRKIAAEALATHVAFEYSGGSKYSTVGLHVGYQVGGRKAVGQNCRIEYVTEKIMLNRILSTDENNFDNVGCIIIDEAHERSITCDILLGSFKKEDPRWKNILLIVMSATIDLQVFQNYFPGSHIVEIEGRIFPIEIIYKPVDDYSDEMICSAVSKCAFDIHQSCIGEPGDILCFLHGQEDVLLAKTEFEKYIVDFRMSYFSQVALLQSSQELMEVKVFALFGKQDAEEQACVFEKLPKNIRKVIFSTDLAETSVTIEGVKFVVDSGMKKEMFYNPKRNVSSLQVNIISQSSAIQRAGRSGRTQPGKCYRLYSEDDFRKMYVNTPPEIFRRPLSVAVLTLRDMNIDPVEFDWITEPSKEALAAADEELKFLQAIDINNKLTELGKLISTSQQDPKLVRMIYSACKDGFGWAALTLAAVMTVADIVFWRGNNKESKEKAIEKRKKFQQPEGDFVTLYWVFEEWLELLENNRREANDWCRENYVSAKSMNLALSTRNQFIQIFKYSSIWKRSPSQDGYPTNEELQKIICAGYFLQTARLVFTKNKRSPYQYYALHSEVQGKLDFKSALLVNDNLKDPPLLIVYDRIIRLKATIIFPCSSTIDKNWLYKESPLFDLKCKEKITNLPTEIVSKDLSRVCLQALMGKHYCNLYSLEKELGCSIMADSDTLKLTAFCSASNKAAVEMTIQEKIFKAESSITLKTPGHKGRRSNFQDRKIPADYDANIRAFDRYVSKEERAAEVIERNRLEELQRRQMEDQRKRRESELRAKAKLDQEDLRRKEKRRIEILLGIKARSEVEERQRLLDTNKIADRKLETRGVQQFNNIGDGRSTRLVGYGNGSQVPHRVEVREYRPQIVDRPPRRPQRSDDTNICCCSIL